MNVKQGQLAVTINCKWASNRGRIVLVTFVNHDQTDSRGRPTPYLVRRVDGLAFDCSVDPHAGTPRFAQEARVWARADQLRPVDLDDEAETRKQTIEVEA